MQSRTRSTTSPARRALARAALLLPLGAAPVAAAAEEALAPQPLTLSQAVSRALSDGTAARIARLEVGRADDALAQVRGAWLPQLGASARGGWTNRLDESFEAVGPGGGVRELGLATLGDDPWVDVFVEQLLLDFGQLRRRAREQLAAEAARAAEDERREAIALEVTRRYARALRLQERARSAGAGVEEAAWLDERAQLLLEAGRAVPSERERAAIHRAESEWQASSLRGELADARAALWRVIGAGAAPERAPALVPESLPEPALSDTSGRSPANAPALRVLELRRRIGEASVGEARAGYYPTLQLRGGYAHYGIRRFDNFSDEAYVFVGMEVPLFDGFRTGAAVARARKAAEVARLRHASALAEARARVRELARRLVDARRGAELAARRAAASREQQRLADRRLQAGRAPLDEAVAAREQRARDVARAIDARFEPVELWAELQRELGQLAAAVAPAAARAPVP